MTPTHGRRRERRPEERPDELLDAALRLFATQGYRATRLEDVAEAAGVTKGAIYHYFTSKEELLVRALEQRIRSIFTEWERTLTDERAPASVRVRLILRRLWSFFLEPDWGSLLRLLIGEVATSLPAIFDRWARQGPLRGWQVLERVIEEGKRSGEFRADVDAKVAARHVQSGLMMQALLHVHLGFDRLDPLDPDRIFDSTVALFLHGIQPLAPSASRRRRSSHHRRLS